MSNEFIVGGVDIVALNKQRLKILAEANATISNLIEEIEAQILTWIENDDLTQEEAELETDSLQEKLNKIEMLSGVTAIEYSLSYDTEYDSDSVLSCKLQEILDKFGIGYNSRSSLSLYKLQEHLENMESNCRQWHNSNC